MKRKRSRERVALLVQAHGLTDLVAAFSALRHDHVLLGLLFSAFGTMWLVGHVQGWRWYPQAKDRFLLVTGLMLSLLYVAAEWAALA
jgi:hypothetical protein